MDKASVMCIRTYLEDGTSVPGCRGWRQCVGPFEWYPPAAVHFCRYQVEWGLEHLRELESGRWPRGPSGDVPVVGPSAAGNAAFETPIGFAGILSSRVDLCGDDGELALEILADGWEIERLARAAKTTPFRLERRIRRVIAYCSGERPRKVTYKEFVQGHSLVGRKSEN